MLTLLANNHKTIYPGTVLRPSRPWCSCTALLLLPERIAEPHSAAAAAVQCWRRGGLVVNQAAQFEQKKPFFPGSAGSGARGDRTVLLSQA
eukprot:643267-Rhodomonas_salina.1